MACALSPEGFSEEDDNNDGSQTTIHSQPNSDVNAEAGSSAGAVASTSSTSAATTATANAATAQAFPQGFPEIRTKSIERTLIPLVQQVSSVSVQSFHFFRSIYFFPHCFSSRGCLLGYITGY